MRLVVIGNPGSRRTALLAEAARRFRGLSMELVPWVDLIAGTADLRRIVKAGDVVRIDSPGKDAAAERALLRAGAGDETDDGAFVSVDRACTYRDDRGRLRWPRQWFRGFQAALQQVSLQLIHSPLMPHLFGGLIPLPVGILGMFDKRQTHHELAARHVPCPEAMLPISSYDELLDRLRWAEWRQVFVKIAYGSSASGAVAIRFGRDQLVAYTTVEIDGTDRDGFPKLYNTRRIRRLTSSADAAAVVNALCPHHVVVERWLPKAGIDGKTFDLRVVVIDGKACHVVPRLSTSPMTNLHLLNQRGDAARVRAAVGEDKWTEAMDICVRAVAAFPGTLYAGVDLMFQPGFTRPTVLELNAFGDLLPGVLHDGMDTYTAELAATFGRPTC